MHLTIFYFLLLEMPLTLFPLDMLLRYSLLAALGSIQFVSNIVFAYFVLQKTVTLPQLLLFLETSSLLLLAITNHLLWYILPEKYSNITFLFYCLLLVVVVLMHHYERRIVACYSREGSYEILEVTASFFSIILTE
uniref:Uncharacterized protein n=1 Tax=Lactuca sativa TaxID=4236 RepID=A0A9R1X961_LACSA|nr:hypothetical protein LSAT_V11C500258650 [Lactuca sativa]